MKISYRGLIGILGLAAFLRFLGIQSRGIQYDDAFSIFLAQKPLAQIISGTAADTMPPLYYFMLHFWGQISWELWWLRLLSIILGLIGIILVFQITSRLAGEGAGLSAAFLAAISPLQIYHAQDLRMYALTACLVMGYFYFFIRLWKNSEKTNHADWIALILCSAGALYAHNLAGFLLLFPYGFLLSQKSWKWIIRLGLAHSGTLLLFLPWLWLVPGQVEKIQRAFWTPRPEVVEILQAGLFSASNLPLATTWLTPATIFSLGGVFLVFFELWRNRKTLNDVRLLIWCTALPGTLLFLLSYLMRPLFVPRAFLASYLALDGLAGWAIWQGWSKGGGKILLGLFSLAALVTLPYQIAYSGFPRSPFKEAMAEISSEIQDKDIILHDNKLSFFPAHYYAPGLGQKFLGDEPGSSNDTYAVASQEAIGLYPEESIADAVAGAKRVVFILFKQTQEEFRELDYPQHPNLAWLETHGKLEKVTGWNDLQAYYYRMDP
jgi:4-amino-4-deoxy-L-arabinose transferase-like glycosyltransferase